MNSPAPWFRPVFPLLALLAACGGGDPSGPGTGSLAVAVSGLPTGAPAAVTVTGPGSYTRIVTGSVTLSGLTPGSYLLSAADVSAGGSVYQPSPSTQNVSVAQGDTPASAAVAYAALVASLSVTINGLPPGAAADVTVTGPGGYSKALTASETISGLAPGSYTVAANSVATSGAQYDPSPATQNVTLAGGGTASAAVSYAAGTPGAANLQVAGLYLTQSVQTLNRTVPLVKNRDGFLRVFVTANQVGTLAPVVRVRLYSNGSLTSTTLINPPSPTAPLAPDESTLSNSWNLAVPGSEVQPNLSVLVDVDPNNLIAEGNEADNVFPASGVPLALDVRTVPAFNVRFVPVVTSADGRMGNVTALNQDQFLATAMAMHPLSGYVADVRAPYTTTTTAPLQSDNANSAWNQVLSEILALQQADPARYYYGVVNPTYSSGVAGIGYIGAPPAIGWDKLPSASAVGAHEWGHNWGRNHAPCGGASNPDANFPYSGGTIGVYGLDVAAQQVKPPSNHDLMGYCNNEWISDYTYTGVLNTLATQPTQASSLGQAVQPGLLVWGRIESDRLVLEPAFEVTARTSIPEPGPYAVDGQAADGSPVFRVPFTPLDVADDPTGSRAFAFVVPLPAASAANLATLRVTGEGREVSLAAASATPSPVEVRRGPGGVSLRWDATRTPMILVRDAVTGEILSFARGGQAEVMTSRRDLTLTLSNRVRSRHLRVTVPR